MLCTDSKSKGNTKDDGMLSVFLLFSPCFLSVFCTSDATSGVVLSRKFTKLVDNSLRNAYLLTVRKCSQVHCTGMYVHIYCIAMHVEWCHFSHFILIPLQFRSQVPLEYLPPPLPPLHLLLLQVCIGKSGA